ncbi:hypothetical protein MKW98_018334 [Papaver atlanticum]|uniref:Uncharacterized protein n=1 Tax=Papaver atlanticum TaxID=357466 RepID=A0AAD4XU80_9MAGN|nr:hypothetical protein MKW98_018334 [Papaver atlanticum]
MRLALLLFQGQTILLCSIKFKRIDFFFLVCNATMSRSDEIDVEDYVTRPDIIIWLSWMRLDSSRQHQ